MTGVLNIPTGRGPFPAVVLAHGYIDPAIYVSGQGMTRERGYLATQGFVAFHVDYRNHAGSDDDPLAARRLRTGYALDVINAVQALRRSPRVPVDDDRDRPLRPVDGRRRGLQGSRDRARDGAAPRRRGRR